MTYAKGTVVSVERSKAEIDRILESAGAQQRAIGSDDVEGVAYVHFALAPKPTPAKRVLEDGQWKNVAAVTHPPRRVRLRLPLPMRKDFRLDHRNYVRSEGAQTKAWDQAKRERWRGLVLLLKAKLEAIDIGMSTVEREFLSDIFLPDGRTIHEALEAPLAAAYATGNMPPLLGAGLAGGTP